MGLVCAQAGAAAAQQVPLGNAVPQFVDPLPMIQVVVGTGGTTLKLHMCEFKAEVLPTGTFAAGVAPQTSVWGYLAEDGTITGCIGKDTLRDPEYSYIGPVIVAARGTETTVQYINELGNALQTGVKAYYNGTDLTLHWADPLTTAGSTNACAMYAVDNPLQPPLQGCEGHYMGSIPAVVHLHGGEVPSFVDGNPDAWFTSDGLLHGDAYYGGGGNQATYTYPNTQEAAPLWFHDHTLGVTRLNVYAGLAGAYLLVDDGTGHPTNLPGPAEIVPLVIQDRSFDVDGELLFPNQGLNPSHPYWMPELVGDTVAVNGRVWPYLQVDAKRYRFLVINGSNARAYEMYFTNGPAIYQIGTDGGYLDTPVRIGKGGAMSRLLLMPGERADIIIDFAGYAGKDLILRNSARTPFPKGGPPQGSTLGRIMQFRVGAAPATDGSYDPATGAALRTSMVRLVDPATGTLAQGATAPSVTRQLTLNEVIGPGGPLMVLLNNSLWDDDTTETPNEGATEIWEIVNLTADAHPIHTHLTQFQVMNRQRFQVNPYLKVYDAAFSGGVFLPGEGPPLDYATGNTRALGGNPDVVPFLQGSPRPPEPNEAGWKDTAISYPGEVLRLVIRYGPQDVPAATPAANVCFGFDPSAGPGYVWHCHIIDHEDNEMMRRTEVQANNSCRP